MGTIKLPRKLKKGLKSALLAITYSGWKSKEISICGTSTERRFLNSKSIAKFKSVAVTAHKTV
jgi:hypothetical protein